MFVTDLHHFLDLPEDTPGPARRLAEHLANIVRAATAGDAGPGWETALRCRRRPRNRPCPGRMIVLRTEVNHEPNRRRQRRLDAAFQALNTAAQTTGSC
jgi:hypothetical protein